MSFPRIAAGLAGLASLALLASPPATAQDTGAQVLPDSVQALVTEFQQLQARVQEAQAQAIQTSPELQAGQQALQQSVQEAMMDADSSMGAKLDSLPGLQQDAMAAQQSGDTTRLRSIMETGARLESEIREAQDEALEQEEIARELEEFQEDLRTAMVAADPEIGSAIERLEQVAARIQEIQGGGIAGGGT